MHAAEIAQPLPVVRLGDPVLATMRLVATNGLPGVVVLDDVDRVVACLSAVDLLRVALPEYLRDRPCLSRVLAADAATGIAARLADVPLRQVVTDNADRVPVARAEATLVELAELMARRGCPLALVLSVDGDAHGVVTVDRLLEVFVDGAAGVVSP